MTHKSDKALLARFERQHYPDGFLPEEWDRVFDLAHTGLTAKEQKRICNGEPDENGVILDGTEGACPAWGRGVERGWEKGQERIGELEGALERYGKHEMEYRGGTCFKGLTETQCRCGLDEALLLKGGEGE